MGAAADGRHHTPTHTNVSDLFAIFHHPTCEVSPSGGGGGEGGGGEGGGGMGRNARMELGARSVQLLMNAVQLSNQAEEIRNHGAACSPSSAHASGAGTGSAA